MKKIAFLLILSLLLVPSVWAKDSVDDVWRAANSPVYGTKFGGMLGRGLLNIVTSFVDIIVHTVEGSKAGPPIVGTLTGVGSGLGCTALRLTSGALDVVTFWVPGFNGFPVARSYSNCLEFEEGELAVPQDTTDQAVSEPEPASAAHHAEDYTKSAAPAKHDTLDYIRK